MENKLKVIIGENKRLAYILGGGFILLFLILILGVVINSQNKYQPTPPLPKKKTEIILPGKLMLTSTESTVAQGKEITLTLTIDGANRLIDGADAVILFDDKLIKYVKISEENPRFIFPRKREEKGRLIITAIRKLEDDKPTSQEVLAKIVFKAVKKGSATLNFEFNKGKTTGSTVIASEKSQNILGKVTPLTLTIE